MVIYFVSYRFFRNEEDKGFAMTSVVMDGPIATWEDIKRMSYCCQRQSGAKSAVILSYNLLSG